MDIVGEVEVAYDISKAPILAITGTNGKTTTTTLLGEVMKQTGRPVMVGGNIGDSLSEAAMKFRRMVIWWRSFQLSIGNGKNI